MTQRDTPYDVIFGVPGFDEARFELLREQDDHRSVTPTELFMLPAAGDLLRDLLPPEEQAGSHQDVVNQVSSLMFHAYRFWLHDRRVYRMMPAALQPLLSGVEPGEGWQIRVPAPAGYVQFPRNALWARVSEDSPPEPVDGFFWSAPAPSAEAPPLRLDLLYALGVRQSRPGISIVHASVETAAGLEQWAVVDARPGGVDFANVLPGGELQDYHAITTHAEALKLAVLCFWRIGSTPPVEPVQEGGNRVFLLEHG